MQNLNFIKLLETATELILREGVIVHGRTDGKTDWHDLTYGSSPNGCNQEWTTFKNISRGLNLSKFNQISIVQSEPNKSGCFQVIYRIVILKKYPKLKRNTYARVLFQY